MTDLPAHSIMGASSSTRWFRCQAYVKHAQSEAKRSSQDADLGTRAHAIAEQWLRTGVKPNINDTNMLDSVEVYVDYVTGLEKAVGKKGLIEQRFRLTEIEDDVPMFGTSDFVLYDKTNSHLYVADYKHGVGVAVFAEDNPQLLYYALGAWYELGRQGVDSLTLTIVQPRTFHLGGKIKEWHIDVSVLEEFEADILEAVERVRSDPDHYEPGPWCQFCPVAATCTAHRDAALEGVDIKIVDGEYVMPELMTDDDLKRAILNLPALNTWLNRLQDEVNRRIEEGDVPEGMKIIDGGVHRRVWADPEAVEDLLSHDENVTLDFHKKELLSPTQLEALIGKEEMERYHEHILTQRRRPKLVDVDHPAPALGSEKSMFEGL